MKLPPSVGQKKTKAIEQLLEVAGVDANPVPSEIMYVLITCFHES
jgi:DNA methyltransferase 1-associated protein 1